MVSIREAFGGGIGNMSGDGLVRRVRLRCEGKDSGKKREQMEE